VKENINIGNDILNFSLAWICFCRVIFLKSSLLVLKWI